MPRRLTRRTFLASTVAATAPLIVPRHVLGGAGFVTIRDIDEAGDKTWIASEFAKGIENPDMRNAWDSAPSSNPPGWGCRPSPRRSRS
jgi:hypothetical protein